MEKPTTQNTFDTPRYLVRTACWARLRGKISKVTGTNTEEFTCCLRKRRMENMVRCMERATKEMRHNPPLESHVGTMWPTYGVRGRRRLGGTVRE